MVRNCSVKGCKEKHSTGNGIQFHRFPYTRPDILRIWESFVGKEGWKSSRYSLMCSKHFTESSYQKRPGAQVKFLKHNAVPTIFSFNNKVTQKPQDTPLVYKTPETKETVQPLVTKDSITTTEGIQAKPLISYKSTQTNETAGFQTRRMLQLKVQYLQRKLKRREAKISKLMNKRRVVVCEPVAVHLAEQERDKAPVSATEPFRSCEEQYERLAKTVIDISLDEAAETEDQRCLSCLENKRRYLMYRCGHFGLCGSCVITHRDTTYLCNKRQFIGCPVCSDIVIEFVAVLL